MHREIRSSVIALAVSLGTVAAHAQAPAVPYASRPVIELDCDLGKAGGLKEQLAPMLLSYGSVTPEQRVCEPVRDGFQAWFNAYQFVIKGAHQGIPDETIKVSLQNTTPARPWLDGGTLDLRMSIGGSSCASNLCRIGEILLPEDHMSGLPSTLDAVERKLEALFGGRKAKIYEWLQVPIKVLTDQKKGLTVTNLRYATIHASPGDLFSVGSPPVGTQLCACSPKQQELVAGYAGKTCSSVPPSLALPASGARQPFYYLGGPCSGQRSLGRPSPSLPPSVPTVSIPGLSEREKPLEKALEQYLNRFDGGSLDSLLRQPTSKDKDKLLDGLLGQYKRTIDGGPGVAGPAYDIASALSGMKSRAADTASLCAGLVTGRRAREALECVSGATVLTDLKRQQIALRALGDMPSLLPDEVREVTNVLPGLAALRAGIDACAAESPAALGTEEVLAASREDGLASAVYYQLALAEENADRRYCYLSRAAHICFAAFQTSVPCAAPRSIARYLEATEARGTAQLDAAIQRLFVKQASSSDPKCDWKESFCRSFAGDVAATEAVLAAHLSLAHLLDARAGTAPSAGPLSPKVHVEHAERLWARAHPATTLSPNLLNTKLRAHLTTTARSPGQASAIASAVPPASGTPFPMATAVASTAPGAGGGKAQAAPAPALPPQKPTFSD